MTVKELLKVYDNWNGITRINDDNLTAIVEGKTVNVFESRTDLHDKEVVGNLIS